MTDATYTENIMARPKLTFVCLLIGVFFIVMSTVSATAQQTTPLFEKAEKLRALAGKLKGEDKALVHTQTRRGRSVWVTCRAASMAIPRAAQP